MPKNVMKMLKPSPNLGRNAFDLSHRQVFTANFGVLYPTLCVETVPNDTVKIKVADLLRAQPLVTPSFMRCKQHVDVWFVPYSDIWSRFNEFMVDKDEPASSALHYRSFLPHFSTPDLYSFLGSTYDTQRPKLHSQYDNTSELLTILDLLGYNGTQLRSQAVSAGNAYPQLDLNLFRLAAYHYIWYREYRQQYFDDGMLGISSSISNAQATIWNFDDLLCDTEVNARVSGNRLLAMLQPRYRLWKKDLFTGIMPSQQYGNVSTVSNDFNFGKQFFLKATNPYISGNLSVTGTDPNNVNIDGSVRQFNISPVADSTYSSFDILALRKSEAIQKWREMSLRAGNQIEDNFEAHYGSKPKSHLIHHPVFIGSVDSPVNVGDVNATASTGQSVNGLLGDVAGKMIGSIDSRELEFSTNDFGVIIGLYSILPEAEYNANNYDRMNCLLEREDFFVPEYENLGLEAVDNICINGDVQFPSVLGFAPRYFGYKTKIDRCCGQLMNFQGFQGNLRQWCTPKWDVSSITGQSFLNDLSVLYVNPYLFDVNFSVGVNNSDQMIVDMYNEVSAVRSMSVIGMPSYYV